MDTEQVPECTTLTFLLFKTANQKTPENLEQSIQVSNN